MGDTPQRLEAVSRGIAGEEAELGGLVADVKEAAEHARASAATRSDYEKLGVGRRREACHHRNRHHHTSQKKQPLRLRLMTALQVLRGFLDVRLLII